MRIDITRPQKEFIFCPDNHPCMVAGYGAGKSQAAVLRIIKQSLELPGPYAFVEPTFDLVKLIAWPRFDAVLNQMGIEHDLNKSDSIMRIANGSEIIFRSADNPERMVGFEVYDGLVDELDTLKTDHARDVWSKMLARCRRKKPGGAANTLAAVTTPEGFKFAYETWGKEPKPGYRLIKAPTSSNPYLPAGYIDTLRATYSSAQLAAYLDGEFVNLTSGSVYPDFDRRLNHTGEWIQKGEALHIGMDFNIANGAAAIAVLRDGNPHFVAEVTKTLDTPQMCSILKSRFAGHPIYVYPDASGSGRKSNDASATDLALLRQAGFTVLVNTRNPAVKDRVLSMNNMIHNQGVRRMFVNPDTCPALVESLEKQSYDKNGEPDKSTGLDHIIDAAGYMVAYKFPILRNTPSRVQLVGI